MTFEARQPIARRHLARHYLGAGLCLLLAIVGGCQGKKQSALDQPQTPETTEPAEKGSESTSVVAASSKAEEDRLLDKTFDDLKFDIEPGERFEREMLTEDVKALLGKRIRIRGYILPTYMRKGLTQFILVRDDQECCFGPGAALYDCIVVEMQTGHSADFSVKPVSVEGRLTLDELMGLDGLHLAIFHLEGERVE